MIFLCQGAKKNKNRIEPIPIKGEKNIKFEQKSSNSAEYQKKYFLNKKIIFSESQDKLLSTAKYR